MLERLLIVFTSCIDRTRDYLRVLLQDKHGTCQIPTDVIREIARCLLPDVVAYCESEEGKAEFAKWQAEQQKSKS